MIDQATFEKWQDWSKRDDAHQLFVPSDIRQMLGEIERLRFETKHPQFRSDGKCNHDNYSYEKDGRRCSCGALMVDPGD